MRTALWSEPGQESLSDLSDLSGLSGQTEVACLTSVEGCTAPQVLRREGNLVEVMLVRRLSGDRQLVPRSLTERQ